MSNLNFPERMAGEKDTGQCRNRIKQKPHNIKRRIMYIMYSYYLNINISELCPNILNRCHPYLPSAVAFEKIDRRSI